ncbi:hypothetical protein V6N12_049940 [Hibiscus sabdariffa]|uniref:Uncharacterized protein n=1 Tax=Hibiscus sabdariffa TaxID=183260 RepID=A0ABR2GAZ6_9ROSI
MDNELNVAFTQANEEGQWYKSDATTNDARLQISNTKIEALKYEKVDLRGYLVHLIYEPGNCGVVGTFVRKRKSPLRREMVGVSGGH